MQAPRRDDRSAGEALWRFSLALYARPGVAEALIALQDRAGRDVNLILFGLWLGATRGRTLGAGDLAAAEVATAPLSGPVAELRRLRRALKGGAEQDLRRRVLATELAAERQVQARLAAGAGAPASVAEAAGARLAAAEANLAFYLGEAAGSSEAELLRRTLAALMRCHANPD